MHLNQVREFSAVLQVYTQRTTTISHYTIIIFLDIWSMGVTFFTMLHSRKYPFDNDDSKKMLKQMYKYPTHLRRRLKKGLHKEAVRLFEMMLNPNEKERASANDILQYGWLKCQAGKS